MNRSIQIVIGGAVFLVSFVLFFLFVFPLDAVIGHYLAGLESRTQGHYRVTVSKIEPSLIFDTVFSDLRVYRKAEPSGVYQELIAAPKAKIGVSLFSALTKSFNATVDLTLPGKGSVTGRVTLGAAPVLDLKLKGVALDKLPILAQAFQSGPVRLSPQGTVDGDLYLSLASTMSRSEAEFSLQVTDFQLKNVALWLGPTQTPVPDLVLAPRNGSAIFQGRLESGTLNLSRLNIPGGDIEVQLRGTLGFAPDFGIASSDLKGQFALSETLFQKVPQIAMIKDLKNAAGYYPISMNGGFRGRGRKPQIKVGTLDLTPFLSF